MHTDIETRDLSEEFNNHEVFPSTFIKDELLLDSYSFDKKLSVYGLSSERLALINEISEMTVGIIINHQENDKYGINTPSEGVSDFDLRIVTFSTENGFEEERVKMHNYNKYGFRLTKKAERYRLDYLGVIRDFYSDPSPNLLLRVPNDQGDGYKLQTLDEFLKRKSPIEENLLILRTEEVKLYPLKMDGLIQEQKRILRVMGHCDDIEDILFHLMNQSIYPSDIRSVGDTARISGNPVITRQIINQYWNRSSLSLPTDTSKRAIGLRKSTNVIPFILKYFEESEGREPDQHIATSTYRLFFYYMLHSYLSEKPHTNRSQIIFTKGNLQLARDQLLIPGARKWGMNIWSFLQ
jgi:hypothetical protein